MSTFLTHQPEQVDTEEHYTLLEGVGDYLVAQFHHVTLLFSYRVDLVTEYSELGWGYLAAMTKNTDIIINIPR